MLVKNGGKNATQRTNETWKRVLREYEAPLLDLARTNHGRPYGETQGRFHLISSSTSAQTAHSGTSLWCQSFNMVRRTMIPVVGGKPCLSSSNARRNCLISLAHSFLAIGSDLGGRGVAFSVVHHSSSID